MEREELITALRALSTQWGQLQAIEKAVGMPRNTLSGMLNGTRGFPEKWQKKLSDYLTATQTESQFESQLNPPVLPATITADLCNEGVAITKTTSSGETTRIDPNGKEGQQIIQQSKKSMPPPGLTKAETLKWHRQHNQTLS